MRVLVPVPVPELVVVGDLVLAELEDAVEDAVGETVLAALVEAVAVELPVAVPV